MKTSQNKYGWVPDLPDHRDTTFKLHAPEVEILPPSVDLRPSCPPVFTQGNLGSCTANAIAGAHYYDQLKQKKVNPFMPSRLFIYYNEREMENSIECDSGAQIRDGIKTIASQGVCNEVQWPYDINSFTSKPPEDCYSTAASNKVTLYQRVDQTAFNLKSALSHNHPIVFGFSVYESFESGNVSKSGLLPIPKYKEKCLGGHAVMLVGYNDSKKYFIVRNSWGDSWGINGYFYMPYTYVLNSDLACDFWTLETGF